MPSGKNSGSHGSGGSHFNNSSSSGGTHNSSSNGHVHIGRTMLWGPSVVVINGRRYNRTRSKGGTIANFFTIFLCFVAFMVLISGLIVFADGNNKAKYIEQDYRYYQNMIAQAAIKKAEGDDSYITKARITGQKYNTDAQKWYIEYIIPCSSNDDFVEGESFAIYDDNEIQSPDLAVDNWIDVAVSSSTITPYTDSIPMDYQNMAPEKDGQYAKVLSTTTNGRNIMIGAGVSLAVLIVFTIVLSKSTRKLSEVKEEAAQPEPAKNKASAKKQDNYENEVTYCQYCGARIKNSTKKCPHCGAKLD